MSLKTKQSGEYGLKDFAQMCDTVSNLMISMFELEQQQFIYYSQSVDEILGYSPDVLKAGGWSLWFSLLKSSDRPVIKHKLSDFMAGKTHEEDKRCLKLCYHIRDASKESMLVKHEVSLKRLANKRIAVSVMFDQSDKKRIEDYLKSTQLQSAAAVPAYPKSEITAREEQVLQLIGCGLSSKQIADKLYISIHTAISHRKNLIEKFGVKNTAELIKEASKVFVL